MRITLSIIAAVVCFAVVAAPVSAETPSHKIARLQHQVATLKKQVAGLKSANATLTTQLAQANTEVGSLKSANAQAASDLASLRAQVGTLTGQVSTLNGQVSTLTQERDSARAQLASAQSGATGLISTLSVQQRWNLLPTIAEAFNSGALGVWSSSYYASGGNYASWDFTWCGFCA